jgi:hypothetical protein
MAKVTTKNKAKNSDEWQDFEIAAGHDPFNGEVYLYKDNTGYWIENWRTDHYSQYLADENGKLIKDEEKALECFNGEVANAQFSSPIYW